ncbi:hypothetical protein Bacsa_2355 [Phocaeicola salanitronis DSM 18170]|uniref:Glycosyltransferase family 1 protein n=1 Tax=Phocaeicola salanitronis (strain DSM 18170 / JCM 13657 / CCUG 60908 / BL78) TaxID=667015 RepID=F0R6L5_PHOSB|nr:hypothetical protein [Phocaeicola salanitronis]ADY36903.1 hypothetical protein Bacsa_2355 [Phocaeicola salanitronis DSM 18170]
MSTLYVVSPPLEIFEGLKPEVRQHIVMLPDFLRYPSGRFKGITRSLLAGRIPLPKRILYYWFPKKYFDRIIHAEAGDAILIYEACNVRVLRAIRPYLPEGVPCYIYYCNPVGTTFRRPAEELQAIRALGYRLTSFDPCEAERYGMACTGQYFRYPEHQPDNIDSDCFFCGLPKDRAGTLQRLRTRLEAEGLTCDFVIPRTPAEKLTYPQYLDRLARTRCVIDISQKGQTGLTRRPLEALFYGKKLLTDNPEIVRYDFYRPQNVFILGKDPEEQLRAFIESPLAEVPESVRAAYDVNEWIRHYLPVSNNKSRKNLQLCDL